ncbi:MAG: EAL domain-containing response regulator [Pseudomonadales bacterium]
MTSRLLLVDDEPEIHRALQQVLHSEAFEIATAESGKAALDALAQQPVDIVVCDVDMPEMGGVELLAQVRKRYPDTSCLLLSGPSNLDAAIAAMNRGTADRVMTKPWSNSALRDLIDEVTEQSRQLRDPRDPLTQCYSKRWFSNAVQQHLDCPDNPSLTVIFAEVRSPAKSLSMMREDEIRELSALLAERCREAAQPIIDVSTIDRYLLAIGVATPAEPEGIDALIGELDQQLKQPMALASGHLSLAFRYAIVTEEADVRDAEEVLRRGLVALSSLESDEHANSRHYSNQLVAQLHQRYTLEQDLFRALKREELFCLYQPQVESSSHLPRGVETLIRWQHPMQGLVSPLLFIDLAERNGLINDLGIWVMRQAFELQRQQAHMGLEQVRVSVNVSPRQFSERTLLKGLRALLDEFGTEPSKIEIEITESTMMSDPKHALRILSELQQMGFRLALDDFGTGYSSLGQLLSMPLDVIKFDRVFVQSIEESAVSLKLLKHVAALALDLDLEIVAEGVETSAQAQLCKQVGCHLLQGYLFSKPLPLDDYLDYLQAAKKPR